MSVSFPRVVTLYLGDEIAGGGAISGFGFDHRHPGFVLLNLGLQSFGTERHTRTTNDVGMAEKGM
jgi:hypothetical protein